MPRGVTSLSVTTARQMHDAVMASAMDADIFIAVAAVADWRVKNVSAQKLKKTSEGGGAPQMEFEQSGHPRRSGQAARRPLVRGLCRRDRKLAEHAEAKRVRKGIPLLVGNLAQKVMDADTTELVLFDAQGVHPLPAAGKLDAARRSPRSRRACRTEAGKTGGCPAIGQPLPQSAQSGAFPTVCKCASEP